MEFKVDTAADALDQIRTGGSHLLLIANQRVNEVRTALEKGQFGEAMEACNALLQKLAQLSQAQTAMGLLAQNTLMRVGELRNGMVLPGIGPISDVGGCPNCGRDTCPHTSFTVEGQTMVLDRDLEVVVELDE